MVTCWGGGRGRMSLLPNLYREAEETSENPPSPVIAAPHTLPTLCKGRGYGAPEKDWGGLGLQPHLMAYSLHLIGTSLAQPCLWAGPLLAWPFWGAPSSAARARSLREPTAAHSPTGLARRLPPESTSEPTLASGLPLSTPLAPAALQPGPVGHRVSPQARLGL